MDYHSKVKLNDKINKIKDKNILLEIFKISKNDLIKDGKNKYSQNENGIYFNLLLLSDETLYKIDKILSEYFTETDTEATSENITLITYGVDDKVEKFHGKNHGPRLSNQEKNIMLKN
jgi:hypothetical protein